MGSSLSLSVNCLSFSAELGVYMLIRGRRALIPKDGYINIDHRMRDDSLCRKDAPPQSSLSLPSRDIRCLHSNLAKTLVRISK
jgi:hypothetical protein